VATEERLLNQLRAIVRLHCVQMQADPILIRFPQPGILPPHGNILVVTAETNVCAIAVAGFDGLVFADGE
jgi:hypothetical protein